MNAATVALACSGSVTTELALNGCPVVVGYRLGAFTYAILKRLVTTKYVTLFNIAADEEIAPEFIQASCTGKKLAQAVEERLTNPELRARQVQRQHAALQVMGRDQVRNPSAYAAEVILGFLKHRATDA